MDRNYLIVLVGCVAATYGSRVAGFYAGSHDLSDRARRVLAYVPIGAFASIVTLGFTERTSELDARVPAAFMAGILAYRGRPLWLSLVTGLATYGLIRLLFG